MFKVSLPCPEYSVQTGNATRVRGERKRDKELAHILTQMLKTSQELNPECLIQFSVPAQRILTLGFSDAISKGKELSCLMQMAEVTAAKIPLC